MTRLWVARHVHEGADFRIITLTNGVGSRKI